jgi:RNA polymerase primary sigma factor
MKIKKNKKEYVTEDTQAAHQDPKVAALMKINRAKGYLTYEELNEMLPGSEYPAEKLTAVMTYLSDNDVKIIAIEDEESMLLETKADPTAEDGVALATEEAEAALEEVKNDDPVRMYLKEMGGVNLLSREGETAIAKKIEVVKKTLYSVLCESHITADVLASIRSRIADNIILLKDVVANDSNSMEDERYQELDIDDDEKTDADEMQTQYVSNDEEAKQRILHILDKHLELFGKLYAKQNALNFNQKKL